MKRSIRPYVIILILVIVTIVLVIAGKNTDKKETPALTPNAASLDIEIPVIGESAALTEFKEILKVTGILEAQHRTYLSSETGGRALKWTAKVGDLIEKDQVILEFDNEIATFALRQAKAGLESARIAADKQVRDWERFKLLYESGDLSNNEFESANLGKLGAEAALAGAEAVASMAERSFRETHVRMPFRGRLASKLVEVGQSLPPGSPVAEIVQINPIKLQVSIPEEEIVRIRTGQLADIRTVGWKDRVFHGKVHSVGIAADMANRMFPIEIRIPNENLALIPGMAATAEITLQKHENRIVIPRDAVLMKDERMAVFKVTGDRAELTYITSKGSNDTQILVETGIQSGDIVITTGKQSLKPGQKIKLTMEGVF